MIDPDEGAITLAGCLLLRFVVDGRCRDLWEYLQVEASPLSSGASEHIKASSSSPGRGCR
jgi:hypothetical protein